MVTNSALPNHHHLDILTCQCQGQPRGKNMHRCCPCNPKFKQCCAHTLCSQVMVHPPVFSHICTQKLLPHLIIRKTLTSALKETKAESLSTGSSRTTQRWLSLSLIRLSHTETGIFSLRWLITSTFPQDLELQFTKILVTLQDFEQEEPLSVRKNLFIDSLLGETPLIWNWQGLQLSHCCCFVVVVLFFSSQPQEDSKNFNQHNKHVDLMPYFQ